MLDYEAAVAVTEKELANVEDLPAGDSLVPLLPCTIGRPFGWIFLDPALDDVLVAER